MANKATTASGTSSAQMGTTTADAAGIVSIADALAALPKSTEHTMKGFLERQMANEKTLNDSLVEQFGSAIDNSEFAASMNDVKKSFRPQDVETQTQPNADIQIDYLSKIQSDLDRILEIQGDTLRVDVRRDETVIDAGAMGEDDNKSEDEDDDAVATLPVPEQHKEEQLESDDAEVRHHQQDGESDSVEPADYEQGSSKGLLAELVAAHGEQNSLLSDIGDKLAEANGDNAVSLDDVVDDRDSSTDVLSDMTSAQREQTSTRSGIGYPLPDAVDGNPDTTDVPVSDDTPVEAVVRDIDAERGLEKISATLDEILSRFGNSVDNDGDGDPVHVDVNVNLDKSNSASDARLDSSSDTERNDSRADEVPGRIVGGVDTEPLNEREDDASSGESLPSSRDFSNVQPDDSITSLANTAAGAMDAMNIQDDMRGEPDEAELTDSDDRERAGHHDYSMDDRMDADIVEDKYVEDDHPELDVRMAMEARKERDVDPNLSEVQLFNRMSLTADEIHVLASEIGKAVAENIVDREGEKARTVAYLDEVEKIVKAGN